jgi:hypothetical protein
VLENCSFPFAQKILEAVKRNEQQLQQGDRMEGISPEMIQQLQQQMSAADVSESAVPGSEVEQSVAETEQPVTGSEATDV